MYVAPYVFNQEDEIISYMVLPFEIGDMIANYDLEVNFHMASEKSIEKMLSTPFEYTTEFRELRSNVFDNEGVGELIIETDSESGTNEGILNYKYISYSDSTTNLYINPLVITTFNVFKPGSDDYEKFKELFTNDSGDIFIFFDLPDNIATVDNVDKLRTAMNELANIYMENN